jgi:PAS domain S-box-containing protein
VTKTKRKSAVRKREKSGSSGIEHGVDDDAYRMVVEHSPVGVAIIQDGRIVFANSALLEMSGYPLDVTMSLSPPKVREIIHPEDRDRIWQKFQQCMNGELDSAPQEVRLTSSDGMMRRVRMMQMTRIAYRRRPALVTYFDVTQRKQQENEVKRYLDHLEGLVAERTRSLQESEGRLRAIIDASPYPISVSDPLGNMIDCNQALVDLHRYSSKDEIIGKNGLQLFAEKDRELVADWTESKFRRTSEIEPSKIRQFTLVTKDGHEFPAELSAGLTRDASGNPVAIVAVARDLTGQYEYENRLRRAERMAAIGQTATMVAHDLRNPLQGISGAAYVLKQKCSPIADSETTKMFDLVNNCLNYANKIVKELLDYSTEIRLQLAEKTVRTVLDATLRQIKIPATVTIENLAENTPSLLLDESRIQRVFVNLIVNAIEAMPNGGKLTISSRESNEELEIKFIDTGEGISEEAMRTLWKPMKTTKPRGTGLGLAICKEIVEAHGGSMHVETSAGKGSIFTVRLPIKHV